MKVKRYARGVLVGRCTAIKVSDTGEYGWMLLLLFGVPWPATCSWCTLHSSLSEDHRGFTDIKGWPTVGLLAVFSFSLLTLLLVLL